MEDSKERLMSGDRRVVDPTAIKRESDWFSCFFNLSNTIMGAGILSLPYAFSQTGWILGTVLLMLAGCLNFSASYLVSLCAAKTQPSSVAAIMAPFGKWWTLAVDINMIIQLFGTAVIYLIVVGDLMPDVIKQLGGGGTMADRKIWVLIGFCITAPLSVPHNIDFLQYSSASAIFFIIFLCFMCFMFVLPEDSTGLSTCGEQELDDDDAPCKGETSFGIIGDFISILQVISIFLFGFSSQITCFPVCNELINPTQKRLNSIFLSSTACSFIFYVVVAYSGYASYGQSVKSDVLVNYPEIPFVSTTRIFISLVVIFSYPLQFNPARRSTLTVLKQLFDDPDVPVAPGTMRFRYYLVTAIYFAASLGIAMVVEDLGLVVQLMGAVGSILLMFIMPGACFLALFPKEEAEGYQQTSGTIQDALMDSTYDESGGIGSQSVQFIEGGMEIPRPKPWIWKLAWFQLITGIIIAPLCLVAIFL